MSPACRSNQCRDCSCRQTDQCKALLINKNKKTLSRYRPTSEIAVAATVMSSLSSGRSDKGEFKVKEFFLQGLLAWLHGWKHCLPFASLPLRSSAPSFGDVIYQISAGADSQKSADTHYASLFGLFFAHWSVFAGVHDPSPRATDGRLMTRSCASVGMCLSCVPGNKVLGFPGAFEVQPCFFIVVCLFGHISFWSVLNSLFYGYQLIYLLLIFALYF